MELKCILDNCPKTGGIVDWRRCQPCEHLAERDTFGKVDCLHPDATPSNEEERRTAHETFRAMAGVAHITHVGPVRG